MRTETIQQTRLGFTKAMLTFRYRGELHTPATLSHKSVYADMLLAGAGGVSREDFLRKLKSLGSKIFISANNEFVTITILSLDANLSKTLKIAKDLLSQPNFDQKEIKRVKELLVNQIKLSNEDARYQTDRAFSSELFQKSDTRYFFANKQLVDALSSVVKSNLLKTHRSTLASEWNLTVAGSPKTTRETEKFFMALNKKLSTVNAFPVEERESKMITKRITRFIELPSKQNIEFNIGSSLGLRYTDDDYPAFIVGVSILGLLGGFAGRLMSTVREKEGLTYGIYAFAEHVSKTETGYWKIKTFFSPNDALRGLASTKREIKKIVQKGITANELTRFKQILQTRDILQNDSIHKRIMRSHKMLIHNISNSEDLLFKEKIQNLQKEEVDAVLKKYIDPEILVITAAGPVGTIKNEVNKLYG